MSCSPIALKDYLLNELADSDRRTLEAHIKTCPACCEELDRLRLTEAALFSLREEEIPQRIAFVSDPVFQSSGWRRWWAAFWASPARVGFAAAAMLSAAVVFSAATRPAAPAIQARVQPAPVAVQSAAAVSESELAERIQAAVDKAVNASQERQMARVKALVDELEQSRQQLKLAAADFDWSQRHEAIMRVASNKYGPPPRPASGEQK
jgi:anti-sigma factor RsiW